MSYLVINCIGGITREQAEGFIPLDESELEETRARINVASHIKLLVLNQREQRRIYERHIAELQNTADSNRSSYQPSQRVFTASFLKYFFVVQE